MFHLMLLKQRWILTWQILLSFLDQGRLEKDGATIYYVYGIEDLKYEMKAYKYVGPSGDTSSYLELKVESGSEFSPTELLSLLDNEYITVTAK